MRLARALAASISEFAHRHTGIPAMIRGAGRPAFSAALVIRGAMCSPIARSSAIHSTVPSVSSPAICSITGPSAATRTGIGVSALSTVGLCTVKLSFSTSTSPGPARAALSTSR